MQDEAKLKEILETQDLGGIDKVVESAFTGQGIENVDTITRYVCDSYTEAEDMDGFKTDIDYAIDQLRNIRKNL